jgi:hypothetical protein
MKARRGKVLWFGRRRRDHRNGDVKAAVVTMGAYRWLQSGRGEA